jgi:hypothetical protein
VQDLSPGQSGVITITGVLSPTLPGGARVANTAEIAATVGVTPTYVSSTVQITVLGLVLHLPLDEPSGATTFEDVSGNNNHGACSGDSCPTAGVAGKIGLAAQFDGGNDVITVEDAPTLRNASFSLSLWFQWDSVDRSAVNFLTGKGLTNMELHTGGIGDNGLRFIPAGFPNTCVDASNVITTGWNHVAATYDGSAAYLYVNGTLVGSHIGIAGGNNLLADASAFHVGRRADGSYPFAGVIDNVRIYNRVLSVAEVASLFICVNLSSEPRPRGGPGTGLRALS